MALDFLNLLNGCAYLTNDDYSHLWSQIVENCPPLLQLKSIDFDEWKDSPHFVFALEWNSSTGKLQLLMKEDDPSYQMKSRPLAVNLDWKKWMRQAKKIPGGPFWRAIGLGKSSMPVNPKVLDLTMGMGKDSVFLTTWGCHVHAIERNPLLFSLLWSEHFKVIRDSRSKTYPFEIYFGEGESYLNNLSPENYPDVIYIDPMFLHRGKKEKKGTKSCKEMEVFREMVGPDLDAPGLLELALQKSLKRVVLKVPGQSPLELFKSQPKWTIQGKTIRYDVFLPK